MTVLWLDARVRVAIEREAVARQPLETGGALFGWRRADDVVVACASGPGRHARHRRRFFGPHTATTAAAMRAVRDASAGRYAFLGSWHTHPGGTAHPSRLDTRTAQEMADQPDLLLPQPVLLILAATGSDAPARTLGAWHWHCHARTLRPAVLRELDLAERHCPDPERLFLG